MNAIMTDFDFKNGSEPVPQKWEGLAEFDRALAEIRRPDRDNHAEHLQPERHLGREHLAFESRCNVLDHGSENEHGRPGAPRPVVADLLALELCIHFGI